VWAERSARVFGFANSGVYKIIFLGFVVRYKQLENIINYLAKVRLFGKVELSVVGNSEWDAPYFQELCDLVEQRDCKQFVTFHGELPSDQALAMLADSHALIYTNAYDNCPNVVLEAMSLRVPVLALENPVVRELSDKFGGVVFFNFDSLADEFIDAIKKQPVSNFNFTWDDHSEAVLSLFNPKLIS